MHITENYDSITFVLILAHCSLKFCGWKSNYKCIFSGSLYLLIFFVWVMLLLSFYEILTYVWFLFVSQQKGDIYTLSLFRLSLIVKLVYRYIVQEEHSLACSSSSGVFKVFLSICWKLPHSKDVNMHDIFFVLSFEKCHFFFYKNSMFTNFLILDLFLKFYNYILKRTCWFYFIMQSDLKKK